MKNYIIITLSLILLCFSCKNKDGKADSSPVNEINSNLTEDNYALEKGIIKYKYTGSYTGTRILYFKDSGKVFRIDETYINQSSALKEEVNQVFISANSRFYYYDLNVRKGFVVNLDSNALQMEGNMLYDFSIMGIDSAMTKHGYKMSGTQRISGKQCETYKSVDGESQFCFWNGINIKTDLKLGEQINYSLEAIDIDRKANITDDLFQPLKDIPLMEYNEYLKSETKDKL